jgi:Tfp pilus assembly protein PilZ
MCLFIFYLMYRLVSIKEPTDLYADYLVYYRNNGVFIHHVMIFNKLLVKIRVRY